MSVTKVLEEIKARIDAPEKWCKGEFYIGDSCCLLGSYNRCHEAQSVREKAYSILEDLVVSFGYTCLAAYNDAPKTTHKDIMNFMDLAIENSKK